MLNRLDKEHFYFCPPTKLLTNNLLNSLNKVMVFGGNFLNHTLVGPFKVVGKALHIISSGTPCRCMVVLNVAMWSQGSCVPSYESKVGVLNLEGKGWLVMDAVKGEYVIWTRSSIWLTLMESFISSIALFIWSISLYKCGTLWVTIPLDWSSSTLFSTPSHPEFWPRSPLCRWRCLLTSLVNYWFCCISSAIIATMDYNYC